MKILLLFFTLFVSLLLNSQELIRKASLGAQVEQAEKGILVTKLIEGTALNIKLRESDIILEINNVKINDYQSLFNAFSEAREGDKAEFLVERKKKQVQLKGKFIGSSFETSTFSEVIYDKAPYKDGLLRVIINKPNVEGKRPAMLFIPGYTCSSIDNLSDNHPYKRIIDVYAKAGFVTLRIEKSGLGDSFNTPS